MTRYADCPPVGIEAAAGRFANACDIDGWGDGVVSLDVYMGERSSLSLWRDGKFVHYFEWKDGGWHPRESDIDEPDDDEERGTR